MPAPKIAYILLWFPKPSETFIFREVVNLWNKGLRLRVFTLYGELQAHLSPEMQAVSRRVERLGLPAGPGLLPDFSYWWRRRNAVTRRLLKTIPLRRWRSVEVGGENLWAFLCGFTLARRFLAEGIEHIHAPWANGPATAAWVASQLTGIPFSFTGRAVDICPPDGALAEKIRDSILVRAESRDRLNYLKTFAGRPTDKIILTYNGVPLEGPAEAPVPMTPPYRLLGLGRFARFKGFQYLLQAAGMLRDRGVPFHLTLAGTGVRGVQLKLLSKFLRLGDQVSFPGFIPYHQVSQLFQSTDIFVMPSIIHTSGESDGLPTVILEALSHRVPVVATDVAGIGEVIQDGVTGYLVPPKDPAALASAIIRLAGDREAALRLAHRGRALVKEFFDPERCHQQVWEIFQKLCRPRETPLI